MKSPFLNELKAFVITVDGLSLIIIFTPPALSESAMFSLLLCYFPKYVVIGYVSKIIFFSEILNL